MSAQPARSANSRLVQPLRARSSAMSCESNRGSDAIHRGVERVDIVDSTLRPACFACQQQNEPIVNKHRDRVLASKAMPKRPVFHAELGRFLVELRDAKDW